MDAFRHAVNAFLRLSVGGAEGDRKGDKKGPRGKGETRERPATADPATGIRKVSSCIFYVVRCSTHVPYVPVICVSYCELVRKYSGIDVSCTYILQCE
jgi:hypothetical protein